VGKNRAPTYADHDPNSEETGRDPKNKTPAVESPKNEVPPKNPEKPPLSLRKTRGGRLLS
jgi:hypothetical protein